MSKIVAEKTEIDVQNLNMSDIANLEFHEYFLYMGSLTTPGCNEGVKWILPTAFSHISSRHASNYFVSRQIGIVNVFFDIDEHFPSCS